MKRYGLFFGLLLSALLLASQAMAATVAKPSGIGAPLTDSDGAYNVILGASSTTGCTYEIYENNIIIYSGLNRSFWVTGRTAGSYDYKGRAIKAGFTNSADTATVTTVVTGSGLPAAATPNGIGAVANDTDGDFSVIAGASSTSGVTYVFEESVDAGAFTQVASSTSRTYLATGKAAGSKYSYRAKATKAGMSDSAYTSATAGTYVASSSYCAACHTTTASTWAASRHGNSNATPNSAWTSSCGQCHSPTRELAGGFMAIDCLGCHSYNGTTNTIPLAPADHPGVLSAATIASCAGCHDNHYSASNSIASDVAATGHSNCVSCHDPHTAAVPASTVCATCHNGTITAVAHAGELTDCTSCHNVHTPNVPKLVVPGSALTTKVSAHGATGQIAVSNVVVSNLGDGGDADTQEEIQVTFNVTRDGAPFTFDGSPVIYRAYEYGSSTTAYTTTTYTQNPINNERLQVNGGAFPTATTLVSAVNGAYTVVVNKTPYTAANAVPAAQATFQAGRTYMFIVTDNGLESAPAATVTGYLGSNPRDIASNVGCINCHGSNPFWKELAEAGETHHGATPQGTTVCVVCHTVKGSVSRGQGGDRTTAYVHGIHASEQSMNGYDRQFPTKDGVIDFEVTYPTYMTNCSVCHTTPAQLTAVNTKPVSYSLCFSCHDSWANWGDGSGIFNGTNHNAYTWNTSCVGCHEGTIAPANTAAMHNGLLTERSGLIYNGEDVSVIEGAKVDMQLTGVSRILDAAEVPSDTNAEDSLAITWTANYNGAAVNPCNTTVAVGAPIFAHGGAANATTGKAAGGLSILRAYGQGDDWTNAGIGTSPGQPVSTNIATTNTVCASNVATTTVPLTATEQATAAIKGIIAIQGKAQVSLPYTFDDPLTVPVEAKSVIAVRSKTPTREFVATTGALPGTPRRAVTDTASCLKCHVGSLYQHGGNRIDNVELCIMCHNEASSEQSVRVFDGVDASEAYDGKTGQTYGFKSLLHAVHSAGENGVITMVHRTNGNYVFAGHTTVIPNYPTVDVYADGGIDDNPLLTAPVGHGVAALVYGSSAPHGTGPVTDGVNKQVYRAHNLHSPTYPQALNNCTACHQAGTFGIPDPTKAVATTVDVGTVAPNQAAATHANYALQDDDTLKGPASAACMSCHASSDPVRQAWLTGHANLGGFTPDVLPNGRADVINGTTVENCTRCHQ